MENNPISMFGNLRVTALPFVIGFLATAGILFRAATLMPMTNHDDKYLRRIFVVLSVVVLGLPITPFTVNSYFYYAHVSFATIFYVTALWSGVWFLYKRKWRDALGFILYAAMTAGIVGAILSTSEVGVLHLLAISQLTTISVFSVLFVRSILHMETAKGAQSGLE